MSSDKKIISREPMMADIASQLDYSFEPKNDTGISKFLSDFKLFKLGRRYPILNVIRKKATIWEEGIKGEEDFEYNYDTAIFDFRYVVSTGKTTVIYRQSVCMFFNKKFGLPHFYMVPETWQYRIGEFFGIKDIDFIEYPKFSKDYYLKGPDPEFIEHTFKQPEIMRIFEKNHGYNVEGCGYVFVIYKFNKLLSQPALLDMIDIGHKLCESFGERSDEWKQNHKIIQKIIQTSQHGQP